MLFTRRGKFLRFLSYTVILIVLSVTLKSIYIKHRMISELQKKSLMLEQNIKEHAQKINVLKQEIQTAENNPEVLKRDARDRFLMLEKNESVIIFKDK